MKNPWEEIALSDYENHMKLDSVFQLQAMNEMMKKQFSSYPVHSVMILGISGGNGLTHIDPQQFTKVYGVDINKAYLKEVENRYAHLRDKLSCLEIDLIKEAGTLPQADLLIANLLIEYIGYEAFQKVVQQVQPQVVSCIIQMNEEDGWISDSPYLHAFDDLNKIHHQMEELPLIETLQAIEYHFIKEIHQPLPNGKKLVQLDFAVQETTQ